MDYKASEIENKWQKVWEKEKIFNVDPQNKGKKYYCLEMFPYPSGKIHMGHVRNYSIGDVIARFKRMQGFNVLHPIGWDSLGLPAENAAKSHGIHPQDWTLDNIEHMRKQLKKMGFSYDWSRELATCLPEYYKWNQYIFIKMYEKGLAYKKKSAVNWCPTCATVLANEQANGGHCWRCDSEVESKNIEQWFLKTTEFVKELLNDHGELKNWPEQVLTMQKNWIGRSEGAELDFPLHESNTKIKIFTTRLDTIFGATFFAMSVDHFAIDEILENNPLKEQLIKFIKEIQSEKKQSREEKEKKGIFTGKYVINPISKEKIPIWLANFVLSDYGTGAIMSVPAHDERDNEFALKYNIPIKKVVSLINREKEQEAEVISEKGQLINSGEYNGLTSNEAIATIGKYIEENNIGKLTINYKLRDWGLSRQRYWGTPIPVVYCKECGIVTEKSENLPVKLPKDVNFSYEGGSPLEQCPSFLNTKCPKCNGEAKRETDTMDTFFDSSWYFFRYASQPQDKPFDEEEIKKWLPVDIYIGGIEHAILHLIYARFFTKVFKSFGWSDINEPFPHLLTQGMVTLGGSKMSKSKGNIIEPDDLIEKYGADTARLFTLFAAPPDKSLEWNNKGVEGCSRFLKRLWNFYERNLSLLKEYSNKDYQIDDTNNAIYIKFNQTVKKVSEDIGNRFHLNTAIASLMEFFKEVLSVEEELKKQNPALLTFLAKTILQLISPFTPHIANELWSQIGEKELLEKVSWPIYDNKFLENKTATIMVQINGKIRDKISCSPDCTQEKVEEKALKSDKINSFIQGKKIIKTIYIKNKMLSLVIK